MISNELVEKLKKLYFTKYGIKLSDEDATKVALEFINLMKVLLKPKIK